MTDAIFYTAYDDMPPAMVRLRRGRKPGRGFGNVGLLWSMAAAATVLSAMPALAPGRLHMPTLALRSVPPLTLAAALPVPRRVTDDPLLLPAYVAGVPSSFAMSRPVPSRLVAADAPKMDVAVEAAAPGVSRSVAAAAVTEPAAAGPQLMAAADADDGSDIESVVPKITGPATPLLAADVPLPMPRPNDLAPTVTHVAPFRATRRPTVLASAAPAVAPAVSPDNRGFLEKFFGVAQQPNAAATPVLGYAAPEDSWFSGLRNGAAGNPARSYGEGTAVYEIASHTVFLPDGSRLEAHSGLGERLDDARFVRDRMKGPTPPATYALTLRESLFHGVQALRLTPLGSSVFGRNGLLAHTYMLGPRGDSNGCVSFRNYKAFLDAFHGGIRRLVVVAKLN